MSHWKRELTAWMINNGLNRAETIKLINLNGGNIKQSGFSHWMNREGCKPNTKNCLALEKITKEKISVKEIVNQ